MTDFFKQRLERLIYMINGMDKEFAEIKFWRRQIDKYVDWYEGDLPSIYGHLSPSEGDKIKLANKTLSALLTFFEIHQKPKYVKDLLLDEYAMEGMKILDIGSGPFPSALAFKNCEVYSLDPLIGSYISAGYPLHCYEQRGRFVCSQAETIPFYDGFFDAVVSVNAIDHVNDFEKTALEVRRVLKSGGRFRMHVHYHPKTTAEPLELTDEFFYQNYSWVTGLKKIHESNQKLGTVLTDDREKYVVWGN